jgi:TonB family protein
MFLDFVLSFDVRLPEPNTELVVVVRGLREKDELPRGEALRLRPSGPVLGLRWQHVEVRAAGSRVVVSVDGTVAQTRDSVESAGFGYIVFQMQGGRAEIRSARIAEIERSLTESADIMTSDGVEKAGGRPPRLIYEVKPKYTPEALRAVVQGIVKLNAVVLADGSVGTVRVTRSLHSGLDAEAVRTVRKWKFAPATLNGRPIPVVVEVDMTFKLK